MVNHKEDVDAGGTVPKSPEGRDGREPQIRPGTAAAKLRAGATKDGPLQTPDLEDDAFADSTSTTQWTNMLPAPLPASGGLPVDVLRDPWRAYIGTPHATRRSAGAHFGLSQLLNQSHQSLGAFLVDASGASLTPIA